MLQWGFRQCLPFSWTTLRDKHCRQPIAVMGVVDTFGPSSIAAGCKLAKRPVHCFTVSACGHTLAFSSENWNESFYLDQAVAKAEKPELREARGKPSSAAARQQAARRPSPASAACLPGGGRVDGSGRWRRRLPAASLWPFLLNKQQRRSSLTVLGRVLYIVIQES